MLEERNSQILGAAVREYIRTGRPVASRELTRGYRLRVSPATIRTSMLELDELGYLEQPHTSAGRVPTDRGYRYFVDYLIPETSLSETEEVQMEEVFSVSDEEEFLRLLGRTLAGLTGAFTATGSPEREVWYKTGLSGMLGEPDITAEYIQRFGHLADGIEDEISELVDMLSATNGQTFIGEENPLKDARFCSMLLSSWRHPKGFAGFVVMVAPRRTNYAKHLAILRKLREQ